MLRSIKNVANPTKPKLYLRVSRKVCMHTQVRFKIIVQYVFLLPWIDLGIKHNSFWEHIKANSDDSRFTTHKYLSDLSYLIMNN